MNFDSYYASDPDTTAVVGEDDQEPDSESLYETPYSDLAKWHNRPSIGSGHEGEGDPKSPSEETGSSLLGSRLDGVEYTHRMDSPTPLDETLAEIRDERRYRMLLQHEFHPSRMFLVVLREANTLIISGDTVTLPLWSPSTVEIGSVGYLRKPEGEFVTLFNAFDPPRSSNGILKGMANLHGYGKISQGSYRQDKRNRAQRGLDVIQSLLLSKSDPFVNILDEIKRVSQLLRVGTTSTGDIPSV